MANAFSFKEVTTKTMKITGMLDTDRMIVDLDGEEKSVDDKIGNIMRNYGYTPVTIYFIEGKCVNAKIGTMNTSNLKQFFKK